MSTQPLPAIPPGTLTWQVQVIELFRESTITQGLLAITLTGLVGFCVVKQITPPDYLLMALGTVYGFYFRAKADYKAAKAVVQAQATAAASGND